MRHRLHRLIFALLLLLAAPARADSEDEARSLYQRGMAHFQLDEFEVAIQLWQQAYRLKPAPELLYDIAQAYRFSSERSLAFYRKYLQVHPHAANRAEVERQIAQLTRQVSEQQNPAPPPPPAVLPAAIKRPAFMLRPTPAPTPAPTAEPRAPASASAQVTLLARPPDGPIVKKGWFWAGLGITAAVIAVGVGVGVTYGTRPSDPNPSFGIARGN